MDAARHATGNGNRNRPGGAAGGDPTTALHSDLPLPPTIDICTLEFPENYTQPSEITSLRVKACNLRKLYEDGQKLAEREQLERLATISGLLRPRHIRHQRQHMGGGENQVDFDPRSRFVGQHVVVTNEQLRRAEQQGLNVSGTINR